MNPHEDAFITAFIIPDKQERYRMLLGSPKRRKGFLRVLYHGLDTVPSLTTSLEGVLDIASFLKKKGAGKMCHVIANDENVDGKEMPLHDALAATLEHDSGAVICCVPGELALYRSELDLYLLEKPKAK